MIFYCKDGCLWYRDWAWGDDDLARARMERQAEHFEGQPKTGLYGSVAQDLATECRRAIADFDQHWSQYVDA